jgi:DNA-binding CsgD family transcriptional regulator
MENQIKSLTKRETEIAQQLNNDLSLQEVAKELYLSYDTVQFHIKSMKSKHNVNTLHGLVAKLTNQNNTI